MPFLGSTPPVNYKTLTKQTITGDSSTAYTLNEAVANANEIEVFVNNVRQQPTTDYTANNRTITFTDPLLSTDSCWLVYQGKAESTTIAQTSNIADGAVTASKLSDTYLTEVADDSITSAKLANGAVEGAITAPLSHRNLIINGAMQVWQRGTSTTSSLSNAYSTADRWKHHSRNCTSVSISQESFTVGQTSVPNEPQYYLRNSFSNNSGSTPPYVMQLIEDVRTAAGQKVTVSFYAKCDSTHTVGVYFSQQFGSGGSSAVDITGESISIGTSWAKYTATIDIPSISGKTIGTSSYLRMDFRLTANTAVVFDVTQVQLEIGSVATPFEHRSYGEELVRCQRYYFKADGNIGHYGGYGRKYANAADSLWYLGHIVFPVQMRASPSSPTQSPTYQNCSNLTFATTTTSTTMRVTASAAGAYRAYEGGDVYFDAEL